MIYKLNYILHFIKKAKLSFTYQDPNEWLSKSLFQV